MSVGPDDASFGRDGRDGEAPGPEPRTAPSGHDHPPSERAGPAGRPTGRSGPAAPQQHGRPRPAPQAHSERPPDPPPRPRIVDDPGILGLSRVARSRIGSRLFTWFFVLVFAVIIVQMVVAILDAEW